MAKPPPHDPGAELSVVGAVLINPDAWEGAKHLRPDDFFSDRLQAVWRAIRLVHQAGQPIDPALVHSQLVKLNLSARAGSPEILGEAMTFVPRSANAAHYAGIVAAHAQQRTILDRAVNLARIASNGGGDLKRAAQDILEVWEGEPAGDNASVEPLYTDEIASEPVPEIDWAVEGWLSRGDCVVISGDGGVGKSWVALDLAVAIATGSPWLGKRTRQSRVLIIDEENPEILVRRRVKRVIHGRGIMPPRIPYFVGNRWNLDNPHDLPRVLEIVKEHAPDWVVFDSLVRFHHRDENANMEMAGFFAEKINPIRELGPGIILLHHLAKPPSVGDKSTGYRLRGASEIRNYPEHVWGIDRRDGQLTLEHVKCRIANPAETLQFAIEDTPDGQGIRLEGDKLSTIADDHLIRSLAAAGSHGIPRPELVRILEGEGVAQPDRAATRALGRLAAGGTVRRKREGHVTRYWIASEAP